MTTKPTLIIFGGLPGTGKTTLARKLAAQLDAVFIRVDTIEQVIIQGPNPPTKMDDTGYRVGYALADDNLRNGKTVVADSVNPLAETREAWRRVAETAELPFLEIEVRCRDTAEHRRRVEDREPDIPGMKLPTWQDVLNRRYEPWGHKHLTVDTAGRTIDECIAEIREKLPIGA